MARIWCLIYVGHIHLLERFLDLWRTEVMFESQQFEGVHTLYLFALDELTFVFFSVLYISNLFIFV